MEMKFKEKETVYYFLNLKEDLDKIENLIKNFDEDNFTIFPQYSCGSIIEIHIKDSCVFYDVKSFDAYGNPLDPIKYIPEEFLFKSHRELKEIFTQIVMERNNKLIENIKKFNEIIKRKG